MEVSIVNQRTMDPKVVIPFIVMAVVYTIFLVLRGNGSFSLFMELVNVIAALLFTIVVIVVYNKTLTPNTAILLVLISSVTALYITFLIVVGSSTPIVPFELLRSFGDLQVPVEFLLTFVSFLPLSLAGIYLLVRVISHIRFGDTIT